MFKKKRKTRKNKEIILSPTTLHGIKIHRLLPFLFNFTSNLLEKTNVIGIQSFSIIKDILRCLDYFQNV